MRLIDRKGVTSIEYAMLLSLIAAVVIVPVVSTGASLQQIFCTMGGAIGGAACADASAATTPTPTAVPIVFPPAADIAMSINAMSASAGFLRMDEYAEGSDTEVTGTILTTSQTGVPYSVTSPISIVSFGSGSPGPWGAIADNSADLALMNAACAGGASPLSTFGVPAGPVGGVPVVTSIANAPPGELKMLGYDDSALNFSGSDSVVTCSAPAG